MSRLLLALALLTSFWSTLPGAARAQTGLEHAIQAGDWPAAARQAEAALAAGGVKLERWVQLQLSLGVARARLGEGEAAQRAFIAALALDPELRLAPEEAVEVRSPFMEARGFWSQHSERLGASATVSDEVGQLQIALVDPAALVSRVVVRVRGVGQPVFQERVLAPSAQLALALDGLSSPRGVEYSVVLIDENANRLWQLGTDAQPQRALRTQAAAHASTPPSARPAEPKSARPYYVGAAVSLVVAAGSLAVAAVSHFEREQRAQQWNDADCDGEGSTRGEVCAHERDQIDRYQRLAIGFYAVAGAGLVAGIAALIAAPRAERLDRARHALRCGSGPGLVGLACSGRF